VGVCERQPRTLAVFSRMLVSMIGRERGGGRVSYMIGFRQPSHADLD